MIYFALKRRNDFVFLHESGSEETLNAKIKVAFSNWRGLQPRDSRATIADYMAHYERVKVMVEKI
jgi:hypothetical protein